MASAALGGLCRGLYAAVVSHFPWRGKERVGELGTRCMQMRDPVTAQNRVLSDRVGSLLLPHIRGSSLMCRATDGTILSIYS